MTSPSQTPDATNAPTAKEIPGDVALWFFLMAELAAFAVMILGFAMVRVTQPEMFFDGLNELHLSGAIINTLALLTGSYFAALGVLKVRQQQAQSHWYFIAAALAGSVYLFVKMSEYIDLYSLGFSLHTNTFFSFYFFATFFHYLHVLAGIAILLMVANWLKKNNGTNEERNRAAESIASYWHMVDIVWIVLLPTLYLLK